VSADKLRNKWMAWDLSNRVGRGCDQPCVVLVALQAWNCAKPQAEKRVLSRLSVCDACTHLWAKIRIWLVSGPNLSKFDG